MSDQGLTAVTTEITALRVMTPGKQFTRLHGVTVHMTVTFTFTAMATLKYVWCDVYRKKNPFLFLCIRNYNDT
jgi:hypothetical protein